MPTANMAKFEDTIFVARFLSKRDQSLSLNNQVDNPTLLRLMGELDGARVLELGCGPGGLAVALARSPVASYLGLDTSRPMLQIAQDRVCHRNFRFNYGDVEFELEGFYDVVVAALSIHFVADTKKLFARVRRMLAPGGRFVFSVRHPIRTCNPNGLAADRRSWLVTDYFVETARAIQWHENALTIYHRTISAMFNSLREANFVVDRIEEPRPATGMTLPDDQDHIEVPGFLYYRAIAA